MRHVLALGPDSFSIATAVVAILDALDARGRTPRHGATGDPDTTDPPRETGAVSRALRRAAAVDAVRVRAAFAAPATPAAPAAPEVR